MSAEEAAEQEAPKSSNKAVIIVGVVALLLGGGAGFGAAKAMGGDPAAAPVAATVGSADGGAEGTTLTDLGEFTVNLRNTSGGRVLQMKISVEAGQSLTPVLTERTAQLRDAILMLASDYTLQELDGLDSRMAFRDEIHTRLNAALEPQKVARVYFTDFVVQ